MTIGNNQIGLEDLSKIEKFSQEDDQLKAKTLIDSDGFNPSSLEYYSSTSDSSAKSSPQLTTFINDTDEKITPFGEPLPIPVLEEPINHDVEKKKVVQKRLLGIIIVISITVLYSAISELNQYILSGSYNKPYFLVYYNTFFLLIAFPIEFGLLKRQQIKDRKAKMLSNQYNNLNSDYNDNAEPSVMDLYKQEFIKSKFSFKRMMVVSFVMSLLYVGLNWIWSLGLPLTEVSTSSALYQSATVWVFIFSIVILKERPTLLKCISTGLFIAGVIGITLADKSSSDSAYPKAVLGDILMIVSAFLWAMYEVFTTKFVGDVPRTLVNTYIGFIAVWSTLFGIPMLIILSVTGFESWVTPDLKTFGFITLSALVACMLNYLINWGLSVTSPLFVRSGELMTIPTTLVFDIIVKHVHFPLVAIPGFLCIVAGFVLMLYIENKHMKSLETKDIKEENASTSISENTTNQP
ncbi:hypothetical protein PPL_11885 [Heterostelium album PN500]|uniref:EamA domain-containing protein n=1 Tax=Heterostelium pallidum (strain ATCC 26659 / Pp 5 / PN500) TaxID=670386 RepID=D3BUR3_HETP5|nr:hypothetical protein PPL_11885 [Heterostelium album PN500]EFA74851.1 hypothetical protein PPL_11885 [Heterostelium album PN500]|eukprot:XP_020426985.1 hypothetical protein PPL_11885 [Heterostelium album PN500]